MYYFAFSTMICRGGHFDKLLLRDVMSRSNGILSIFAGVYPFTLVTRC